MVLVWLRLPDAKGGGDIPGHLLALPLGVLGGHAGDLAWAGQIGHCRAVPAGVDVRVAGYRHELVNYQPSAAGIEVQAADQPVGADPTHQISDWVGAFSPVDSCT